MSDMAKRPNLKNVEAAIKAFYGTGYVSNAEIKEMFGVSSDAAVSRIKKPVLEEEVRQNIPRVVPYHVNARVAFEVWGIDVQELVKSREKLKKLGLLEV